MEFGEGAYVDGAERWLTAPAEPTTKQTSGTCDGIDDPNWESECQRVQSPAGEAIAVRERQGVQERVLIYVKRGPRRWDLVLRAADDNGKEFDATVQTVDPMGDGNAKFLVKLRGIDEDPNDGLPEPPLQADLIEPSGLIVVHVVLTVGRSGHPDARALPGEGLEVVDCTINCVPTGPVHVRLIAYRDGAWQVVREGCRGPTC